MNTNGEHQARTLTKREHMAAEILAGLVARGLAQVQVGDGSQLTKTGRAYARTAVTAADALIEELNR